MPLNASAENHWENSKRLVKELHFLTSKLIEELPFAEGYFEDLSPAEAEDAANDLADLRADLGNVKRSLLDTMSKFIGEPKSALAAEARRAAE